MPTFRTSRQVSHTARQMFDLVADVEKYPLFLPMCTGLKVRRRTEGENGQETLVADMSVGYKAIRETFTSRVALDPQTLTIKVQYIDGPFRHLENIWTFADTGTDPARSRVDFFIDYEFRSRMLGLLMGSMFDAAFRRFAEAFERRAALVYGRGRPDAEPAAGGA